MPKKTTAKKATTARVEKPEKLTFTENKKDGRMYAGGHALDCPYRMKGECDCIRSEEDENGDPLD